MVKINLRNFYPFCNNDIFLDIPDEVATILLKAERREEAYRRRMYRHKAHYSLDRGDGIEHDICFVSLSPSEIYERKMTAQQCMPQSPPCLTNKGNEFTRITYLASASPKLRGPREFRRKTSVNPSVRGFGIWKLF